MSTQIFRTPQTVLYGKGSFEKLGEEASLRGKKALIISDQIIDGLGWTKKAEAILTKSNVETILYLGVSTEPTDKFVAEALSLFQKEACDLIISLGGGSCIDTAKAVAVLATNSGYIGDYMGADKLASSAAIDHISIPTTAGTGSEATDATIITNTTNDVKMMIKQPVFMPTVAIVDPVLSMSSPQHVTAATGVDALSHAIEAYISRKAHPMTDMMALSAMKLIVENIETAFTDGENLEAREAMALGSMQAGMAFSNASVCLVHGMSRPIGALFHVPHGYSNAMLLPAVLEFSREACVDRLADLGRIFNKGSEPLTNEQAADLAVESVKTLCVNLNIPNLSGWGIDESLFKQSISKMTHDAIASGSPGNNPRVPTVSELEDLYLACYHYQFAQKEQVK